MLVRVLTVIVIYILEWCELLCCNKVAGGDDRGWIKAVDDVLFTLSVSQSYEVSLLFDYLCSLEIGHPVFFRER